MTNIAPHFIVINRPHSNPTELSESEKQADSVITSIFLTGILLFLVGGGIMSLYEYLKTKK